VLAGKGAATLLSSTAVSSTAPLDGHTTRFEFDEQGELYYVLRSTSRDGKSTLAIRGLGLAAVMGIVRGHKAALRVESAPGKGSSFKVLFPASQGKPARLQRSEQRKFLVGHGTILVIDDEESVRQAATTALENYGYKVVVADNGKEGIELFQKLNSEISLVLLDMTMPVMSGEEALVRLQKIRPAVPVVLSSGYNEAEATRSFTGKGLAGFVQKPYTAAQLAEEVQNALQGRRHHRRGAG